MVLMVSGRCDIPAFYSKWFMNRYEEGFVDVRNPFNESLVSRIYFSDVDLIMFCSKNPLPIISDLSKIKHKILFHVTLTPYKKDIEPFVPPKGRIIEGIKEISKVIGKDNVVVRYDPIFINDIYTLEYHKRAFDRMCCLLEGYVSKIIVSFIDDYKNVRKNINYLRYVPFTEEMYKEIGLSFSASALKYGMSVQTCFESRRLTEYGFVKGECLSRELAYHMTGKKFRIQTARKGKRCECVQMADIGSYNICGHMCRYCYANYDEDKINENMKNHYDDSSLLIGRIKKSDVIKERKK